MDGDKTKILRAFSVGILTLSDKGAAGRRADESGSALRRMAEEAGAAVCCTALLPDDEERIRETLLLWTEPEAEPKPDLILTTGGTGFSPRDVTPEATRAVIEREAPGLSERMRAAGAAHTPLSYLSRGVCGIRGAALIVNLPGSLAGSTESLAALLPLLPHALRVLRGEAGDCVRGCVSAPVTVPVRAGKKTGL